MKGYHAIILGVILSVITLYIVAYFHEGGDSNAVSMYLVVYSLPLIIVSIINGLMILIFETKRQIIKILAALLIPVISIFLIVMNDNYLSFIGLLLIIIFGITNFIWLAVNWHKTSNQKN